MPERAILLWHLLRNSLIPIITLIGLSLPVTISGAVITESVFNYPGMGLLIWNAATAHDFPVLLGATIVLATVTVVGSLLADMRYAVADPRVIVVLMVGFSFIGPLFYHTDQVHTNLSAVNLAPGGSHPLGTDNVGYDVLGRLMVSGQSTLIVGLAAAVLATVVGTLWGAIAGYVGGVVDAIMMRVVDSVSWLIPSGKWWLIYPAGVAIVLTVIAFNFIGDALRAALDVRLQVR